eukprot:8892363-Ditylum_brightwellii.AAC.1
MAPHQKGLLSTTKKCKPMRRTLLEELAKEHKEKGKDEEAQRVYNMLANEKERERAQQLA